MPALPSAGHAKTTDTLLFNIVSYVCGMGGRVFGQAVRRLLLHSLEPVTQVDCMFRRPACADKFIAILGIEHALTVLEIEQYGVYRYGLVRQDMRLTLRVHAYDLENRSDKHVNARLLEPCFDIDHIFWDDKGVFEVDRSMCRQRAGGPTPQACPIGTAMHAVMHRRFCVVNPLAARSPVAMFHMLQKAADLVSFGYIHDQSPHLYIECPELRLDMSVMCEIMQEMLPVVARLPCSHTFSVDGLRKLLDSTPAITRCPTCGDRFCPVTAAV